MTVIHERSPLGSARRQLAEATQAAEAAAAVLVPLEEERSTAQERLAHLEALPVDLKMFDRDRELEIASLRRGLAQLQVRIDTAMREQHALVADQKRAASVAGAPQLRLNEAERKLKLLADLSHYETQNLTIRDHQFMVGRETNEVLTLTNAPATSSAPVQAVAQAA